jgi:hypothetical protein
MRGPIKAERLPDMPKVRLEVNEAWLKRFEDVVPAAISSLEGWQSQIETNQIEGNIDSDDLLQQLLSQIIDCRRNLQSLRIIF